MKDKNIIEICKECNNILTDYAKRNKKRNKCLENKIEEFLQKHFKELKNAQEYKALFLKYVYIKEGMK